MQMSVVRLVPVINNRLDMSADAWRLTLPLVMMWWFIICVQSSMSASERCNKILKRAPNFLDP